MDGQAVPVPDRLTYKSLMLEDVPNLAFTIGYTNASWTLKADLTSEYVCRLINHMDAHGYDVCVPHNDDPSVTPSRCSTWHRATSSVRSSRCPSGLEGRPGGCARTTPWTS